MDHVHKPFFIKGTYCFHIPHTYPVPSQVDPIRVISLRLFAWLSFPENVFVPRNIGSGLALPNTQTPSNGVSMGYQAVSKWQGINLEMVA